MKILNKRKHGIPKGAIYVGRPSKWGNPFSIGADGTREEVIRKFEKYARDTNLDCTSLYGKDLVCWCSPEACHADVLKKLAIEQYEVS